jgi:signal peptidase I
MTPTTSPINHPWNEPIRTFLVAVLLALVFRSFLFEPFHIPSGSMKHTLLVGDYIFVSKYSYGYSRYSFPLAPPLFEGRIMRTAPKRGDVVVFRPPSRPGVDFVKRIVGLPGDMIQMRQGILYINGKPAPQEFLTRVSGKRDNGDPVMYRRAQETLPGGVQHQVLSLTDHGDWDNTGIYTVPPGHYFMMGDNRDDSTDSRVPVEVGGIGFIPEENIVGRAELVVFSLGSDARFWQLWKWPAALRYGRFLTLIE